jgi:hypothetical protein
VPPTASRCSGGWFAVIVFGLLNSLR